MLPRSLALATALALTAAACSDQDDARARADAHQVAADVRDAGHKIASDPVVAKVGAEVKKAGHETGVALNQGAERATAAGRHAEARAHDHGG